MQEINAPVENYNKRVEEFLHDILIEKRALRELEEKYSKEFQGVLKLFKSINDPVFKDEKCTLKRKISSQRNSVKAKENRLKEVSSAPLDSTMYFLADVISEVEDVPYVYRKLDLEDDFLTAVGLATNDLGLMFLGEEKVGLIVREGFFKDVSDGDFYNSSSLSEFLLGKNEKFILVEDLDFDSESIDLLDDMKASSTLTANFPYLSMVCFDIVGERLSRPEDSCEETYDRYLKNLRSSKPLKPPVVNVKR